MSERAEDLAKIVLTQDELLMGIGFDEETRVKAAAAIIQPHLLPSIQEAEAPIEDHREDDWPEEENADDDDGVTPG